LQGIFLLLCGLFFSQRLAAQLDFDGSKWTDQTQVDLTGSSYCAPRTYEVQVTVLIDAAYLASIGVGNVEIGYLWGDGTAPDYINLSAATELSPVGSKRKFQASIFSHSYAATEDCMYPSQAFIRRVSGPNTISSTLHKVSVWTTDDQGRGSLVLVAPNGKNEYYVCEKQPINVRFNDRTILNCNFPDPDDNHSFTKNREERTTQFVYDVANPGGEPQIPNVNITYHNLTSEINGLGVSFTTNTSGFTLDEPMNEYSAEIHVPANETSAGQRYTIQLNKWNVCNPQPSAPVSTTAQIIVIPTPPDPNVATLEFCHQNHYSSQPSFNHAVTHTSNLGGMTGGEYRWFFSESDATPFYTNTSANFDPLTADNRPATQKIARNKAGVYEYYVRYRYIHTGYDPVVVCETELVKITYKVREDITGAPGTPTGLMQGCPGDVINLSYLSAPASYTVGGATRYAWEYRIGTNIASTSPASTSFGSWTAADGSVLSVTTTDGQNAALTLTPDPTLSNIITIQVRVHREWVDDKNTTSGTCAYVYAGSDCKYCPGSSTTFNVTVNPSPKVTSLTPLTSEICAGGSVNLTIGGLHGKRSTAAPYGSWDISWTNEDDLNETFTYPAANTTVPQSVVKTVTPLDGTVHEYKITRIKDNITGCVSDVTVPATAGNITIAKAKVIKRAPLPTPTWDVSSPANGANLCENTNYTWQVAALSSVTLVGRPVGTVSDEVRNIRYVWKPWGASDVVTTTNPYTISSGSAGGNVNGVSKTMTVRYQYETAVAGLYCPSATESRNYTVIPQPKAVVSSSPQTICDDGTATVTVNLTGVASSDWTFYWQIAKGAYTSAPMPAVTVAGTASGSASTTVTIPNSAFDGASKDGAYTFTVTSVTQAQMATGCPGAPSGYAVINVWKKPNVVLGGDNASSHICEGAPYIIPSNAFSWTNLNGGSYTITYTSSATGLTQHTVSGLTTSSPLTIPAAHLNTAPGSPITTIITLVSMTETLSGLTCDGTVSGSHTIYADEKPNAGPDLTVCNYEVNLAATAYSGNEWNIASTTSVPLTIVDEYLHTTKVHIPSGSAGVYVLAWKNTAGCADTMIVTLQTNPQLATIQSVAPEICGLSVRLTGLSGGGNLQPWEEGRWTLISAPSGHLPSPPDTISNGQIADFTADEYGDYRFEWRIHTNCGNAYDQTATVDIKFKQIPNTKLPSSPIELCPQQNYPHPFEDVVTAFTTGVSYTWTFNGGAAVTGNPMTIVAPVNSTTYDATYMVTVQGTKDGCFEAVKSFPVYVKPTPTMQNPGDQTLCKGESFNLSLSDILNKMDGGVKYTWAGTTPSPHPNAGMADGNATVAASPYNHTLTASPTAGPNEETGLLEAKAEVRGCASAPVTFRVTVNPTPVITFDPASPNQTYCSGVPLTQNDLTKFSVDVTGTNLTWSYTGANIGLAPVSDQPAVYVPSSPDQYTITPFTTYVNSTAATVSGTVTVKATYVTCTKTETFTMGVKPKPAISLSPVGNQALCAAVTANTNTFTNIVATPAYSYTPALDYTFVSRDGFFANDRTTALDVLATGAANSMNTIYVPVSSHNGDSVMRVVVYPIYDGCTGDSSVTTLTSWRRPIVNPIADQALCPGGTFSEVSTGTDMNSSDISSITWSFAPPNAVGNGSASGVGNVPSFVAFNNETPDDVSSTVTVNATSTHGCPSAVAKTYKYTVYPNPKVNSITSPAAFCPGAPVSIPAFGTQITKSVSIDYYWTVTPSVNVGLPLGEQNGNIPSFTGAANFDGADRTTQIAVRAESSDGCVYTNNALFMLTLKAAPKMNAITNRYFCPEVVTDNIGLVSNLHTSGKTMTYHWNLDDASISLGSTLSTSGTGNIPAFTTTTNVSGGEITGNFEAFADADGCRGDTVKFTIIVRPKPNVTLPTPSSPFYCTSETTPFYTFGTTSSGTITYEWTNSGDYIGLLQSTYTLPSVPSFLTENNVDGGVHTLTATYKVRSKLNGGGAVPACYSDTATFTMTVAPVPQLMPYPLISECAGVEITPAAFDHASDNPSNNYTYAYNWVVTSTLFPELQQLPLGTGAFPSTPQTGDLPEFVGDTARGTFAYPPNQYLPNNSLWGTVSRNVWINVTPQLTDISTAKVCTAPLPQQISIVIKPLPKTKIQVNVDNCVTDDKKILYQTEPTDAVGSTYAWSVEENDHSAPLPGSNAPFIPIPQNWSYQVYQYPNPAQSWNGFITVVETNNFGCKSDTVRSFVNVIQAPKVFAGPDTFTCSANSIVLDQSQLINGNPASVTYEWFPNTYVAINGNELTLHPTISPGIHDFFLTVTATESGCRSERDTIHISVGTTPSAPIIGDQTYCASETPMNLSIISNVTGQEIYWFRGDYNDASQKWSSSSIIPLPTADDLDSVNMKDPAHPLALPNPLPYMGGGYNQIAEIRYGSYLVSAQGCVSDTAAVTLNIKMLPPTPASDVTTYCDNKTGQKYYTLDALGNNIYWYPDSMLPSNPMRPSPLYRGNSFTAANINVGDTAFYILSIGPNGCASYYGEKQLVVHPNPVVNISMPDTVGCSNYLNTLNNLADEPDVDYVVNWGDGQVDTIAGLEVIQHMYMNSTSINATPVLRFSAISKTNKGGDGLFCYNSKQIQIVAFPKVDVDFSSNFTSVCDQSEVEVSKQQRIQFTAFATNATEFGWNFGDGSPMVNAPNPTHIFFSSHSAPQKYQQTDTFTVGLLAKTPLNWYAGNTYPACEAYVEKKFAVLPTPKAEFSIFNTDGTPAPDWICSPNSLQFDNAQWSSPSNNGVNLSEVKYRWEVDGVANRGVDTTYYFDNPMFIAEDRHFILYATNSTTGCQDTAMHKIAVMPHLSADFVVSAVDGCAPVATRFNSTSPGAQKHTWFWDSNILPTPASGVVPDTEGINQSITFTNSSMSAVKQYHVWLRTETGDYSTGYDARRCYLYKDTVISVYPVPVPDFQVTPDYMNFPDPPIVITNQIPVPERDALDYVWEIAKQGTNISMKILGGEKVSGQYHINAWGKFEITQYVTAPDGHCPMSKTLLVTILPPDPISDFSEVTPSCLPYTVQFENTSIWGNTYLWDFGDGITSDAENPIHTFVDPGVYTVTLVVTGDADKPAMFSREVVVHPVPKAVFNIKPEFLWVGQTAYTFNLTSHLTPSGDVYSVWYEWDWGDGSEKDTLRQPEHVYRSSGDYDITLTVGTYSDPGCISTFTLPRAITVENAGDIIFPNTFKPSPDGEPSNVIPNAHSYRNYLFFPPVLRTTKEYYLAIFTRWGQMIFETTDPTRGWNGYFRGTLCREDAYVYKVKGVFDNGQAFEKMGTVLLLR
jgi:PKD repeat protein